MAQQACQAVRSRLQWLAGRSGLPYLRIDPLKVDVGRVADVMSISYAGRRRGLPVQVEVDSLAQLDVVLDAGADRVLLDNFSLADTRDSSSCQAWL